MEEWIDGIFILVTTNNAFDDRSTHLTAHMLVVTRGPGGLVDEIPQAWVGKEDLTDWMQDTTSISYQTKRKMQFLMMLRKLLVKWQEGHLEKSIRDHCYLTTYNYSYNYNDHM